MKWFAIAALVVVVATLCGPEAVAVGSDQGSPSAAGMSATTPEAPATTTPATPDRAYGFWPEDAYGDLAAFRFSADGKHLTFASVHLGLWCGETLDAQLGTTFRIAAHVPTTAELKTGDVLVVHPRRAGTIRASVYVDRRFADGLHQIRGTVEISRVRSVSVDVVWRVLSRWTPSRGASSSCTASGAIQPIRDPGVLFAGSTSDGEPALALRRAAPAPTPAAAVLLGYDARCSVHWDPWAVVIDAFTLQPDETFTTGDEKTLRGFVFPLDWDAYYRLSGQFDGAAVSGHLDLNARVFDEPRTCRTKVTFEGQTG